MRIHPNDNVEVNLENGQKYALREIKKGEAVIKYGNPIGHATEKIGKGEWVHSHNLATNLSGELTYSYEPEQNQLSVISTARTFSGYLRPNGTVGIRNEVWILPTVGCVNQIAVEIAKHTGAFAFPHPFGCSQLGSDQTTTQLILRGLCNHPNAGGVLILGLGCENNNISEFKKVLGKYDPDRVRFLNCQDETDEVKSGVKIVKDLRSYAETFHVVHIARGNTVEFLEDMLLILL